MNELHHRTDLYDRLMQATTVILIFQAVFLFAQLFNNSQTSGAMTGVLAATLAVSAVNRRLLNDPQGRHASGYVTAWRYGALIFLAAISAIVAIRTYAPQSTPQNAPTLLAMLLAALIALKGAVLGKLKPGGVLGLRLKWTCQSRLAWEMAHRLMGRVLFFGALTCLVAAPFAPAVPVFAAIGCIVLTSVASGAITARHVWRNDPERVTKNSVR